MPNAVFFEAVQTRLEGLKHSAAIVFDAATLPFLKSILPAASLNWPLVLCDIVNVDKLLRSGGGSAVTEWYAFSVTNELTIRRVLMSKLAAAGLPTRIASCINDIFSYRLSRDLPLAEVVLPDARIRDLPAYAIACAPRCGSTFLEELLASVGLGKPEEHLRDKEIIALSDLQIGDNDAAELLTDYMWKHQRNFIFGTKIVSHFLFECLSKVAVPEPLIAEIKEHVKVVYLVRKDKVRQAVSDYLANSVKIWHVRDSQSSASLSKQHADVAYSYEGILRKYNFMMGEDRRLAAYVQGFEHIVVFYEDLLKDSAKVVSAVAEFLGFTDIGTPTAGVIKTDSEAADEFSRRFIEDYTAKMGSAPRPYEPGGSPQALPLTKSGDLQSLAALKSLKFGQYQKRSWQIADYKCRWCPEIGDFIRADQKEPVGDEPFVLAFGSAHTFAPYVRKGYTNWLSEDLSVPFMNLGVGGAGPDFFARPEIRGKFLSLCNAASLVIFQIMSCRMIGSSILPKGKDPKNALVLEVDGKKIQYDSERAVVELRKLGREEDYVTHIKSIRDTWCQLMNDLAREVTVPKILLWLSDRTPAYPEDWKTGPGTQKLYGRFPQLVNEAMVDRVKPSFDRYVEVVYPDKPETLINRFTGRPTKAVFGGSLLEDQTWLGVNDYYPSTIMHKVAADALKPAVEDLLRRKTPAHAQAEAKERM